MCEVVWDGHQSVVHVRETRSSEESRLEWGDSEEHQRWPLTVRMRRWTAVCVRHAKQSCAAGCCAGQTRVAPPRAGKSRDEWGWRGVGQIRGMRMRRVWRKGEARGKRMSGNDRRND